MNLVYNSISNKVQRGRKYKVENLTDCGIDKLVNNFNNKQTLIDWCIKNNFLYKKSASIKGLKEDLKRDSKRTGQPIRVAQRKTRGEG